MVFILLNIFKILKQGKAYSGQALTAAKIIYEDVKVQVVNSKRIGIGIIDKKIIVDLLMNIAKAIPKSYK